MKKITISVLIVLLCVTVWFFRPKTKLCKIIKVKSANAFYLDFNNNGVSEEDELVEMYYARAFSAGIMTPLTNEKESSELSYLADEFAKRTLLNKTALLKFDSKRRLTGVDIEGKDYSKVLLDNGFGLENYSVKYETYKQNPQKIKENIKTAEKLNLVSFNTYSKKYHKLDCRFAFKSARFEIKPLLSVQKESQPCKVCNLDFNNKKNKESYEKFENKKGEKFPRNVTENYTTSYKDAYIELYLSDFTRFYYPSSKCVTTACQSLLREINNSKNTIDFAIYGVSSQPEIIKALTNAKNRGVKIRWVYDLDSKGNSIYSDTKNLAKTLTNSTADYISAENSESFSNYIMHNKFFIFDNKKVWIGSANISETDMSGFNANSVVLVNSPILAKIYQDEFQQLYDGRFHKNKPVSLSSESSELRLGSSKISVFFSPQNKPIERQLVPLVKNARNYIYMPVFVITHKSLVKELIGAYQRGVDVKIILDATGASNKYSPVKELRAAGIKLKVENRPGKMHMKSMLIDDKYTIIGSMNFSKSGENYNDENVLVIENAQMTKNFRNNFLYLWSKIPDKWLNKNPGAESWNSINSCFDGIDNDHDGKIDMLDDSCNWKLKKQVK